MTGLIILLALAAWAFGDSKNSTFSKNGNQNNYSKTENISGQNSIDRTNRPNEDLFISYDHLIFPSNSWKFFGNSTFIKSEHDDGHFILIKEGEHQMSDENFFIQYTVESHYNNSGQKKMYYDNITINNIPVEGKVTNKNNAASVLIDISDITKGAAFNDDAIGVKFFADCGSVLLFNEINCNRGLTDYVNMPKTILNSFLINARKKLNIYLEELEELLQDSQNNNPSSSNQLNFDIYLKVLEFDSVYNVKYDDIKIQYKKLAKKYHPDSVTGDASRFKLVTDTYEYLQENYPK